MSQHQRLPGCVDEQIASKEWFAGCSDVASGEETLRLPSMSPCVRHREIQVLGEGPLHLLTFNMPVSAIDSLLFRNLFGTEEIRAVFEDKAYIRRCVDVEVALANAQSKVGIIPKEASHMIAATCLSIDLDYDRMGAETEIVGYPILPLVRQLSDACGEEAGKYVHWVRYQ